MREERGGEGEEALYILGANWYFRKYLQLLEEDPALKHFKSDKETVRRIKKFGDVLIIIVSAGKLQFVYTV